jgi:flagellar basal body-associated protein FliL
MPDNNDNIDKNKAKEPSKIVDVTKPRQTSGIPTSSNLSSYTLHEQQALEKLKRSIGGVSSKGGGGGSRASMMKTIIAIILVILLIALAVIFVVIIGGGAESQEEAYDVRVSMQIENESSLKIVTDSGQERFRDISPGDTVPVSAYVRNSDNYAGDNSDEIGESKNIYVRFKYKFILNYKEATEKIQPKISNKWYKFNPEDESIFGDKGIKEDDGYYYYLGTLSFMQRAELFSEIEFLGEQIFWEDGGHYGQIQVIVESMEANIDYIEGEQRWPTAPIYWVQAMKGR